MKAKMLKIRTSTAMQSFRPEHLGLGFLMSWVYCSWFSSSLFTETSRATRNDASWIFSLAVCVATIFVVSFVLGKRRLAEHPVAYFAASIGTAAATVLETVPMEGASLGALQLAGSLLTGFFSGLLWILWSEYIGGSGEDAIKAIAPASALAALACFGVSYAIPQPFSALFVAMLPIISGMLLLHAKNRGFPVRAAGDARHAKSERAGTDGSALVIRKVLLVSFALSAISSFAWSTASFFVEADPDAILLGGMIGGIALVLLITLPSAVMRKAPNIARLYRLSIPLLMTAILLLVGGGAPLKAMAEMFLVAFSMSFDFFVLVYFASYASRRFSRSERALCYCEGVINSGIAVGTIAGLWMLSNPSLAASALTGTYLALVAALAFILMLVAEQHLNIDRIVAGSTLQDSCALVAKRFGLTPRECEVLELLGQGRSVPFISDALFLAKSTVETHRKHIYEKMGVHNRQELLDALDGGSV